MITKTSHFSEQLLTEMTERLVAEFDPESVYLFGSYAWGKPRSDSDVDLMVVVSSSAESPGRRAARGYRVLEAFPVSKDILVKMRAEFDRFVGARASLESRIVRRGRLLYGCR